MSLPWVEKYRPQTTAEIVSHERIKSQISAFIDQNALPNLLFHGPAGVGKTTLIKSIARQMFGPAYQNQIIEINASDENGIDVVRDKISAFVKTKQLFQTEQKTKLVVLDECDQMSSVAQGALRRIIELSAGQARFCLICNYISKVIPPLQSRCAVFRFRPVPKEQCIEMLQRVALAEALSCDNQTLNAVYEVGCGDMRQSINLLESCAMSGKPMTHELVFDIAARPSQTVSKQFIQPMTFQERYDYSLEILASGVSLEDLIAAVYKEIMKDSTVAQTQKQKWIKSLAGIEEAMQLGADLRSQLAGFVGTISDLPL
ncbi:Replication_factor C [Hexamita inflata]|uniref:Subunit 3 n=1 Tax=Hexamita inflata TaxID=28002 RepID=A0AA86U2U0_9EUKA|nr:Replication factor C [Hexamita inflata]